ncbi:MAG TPA: hypothetical protein VHG08_04830 [Longimicrobium sp.]|nr:hypothetical protein [Longimicrobium sp.]
MKKLRLELDTLQVDSFATLPDHAEGIGTVEGHSGPILCNPANPTMPRDRTTVISFVHPCGGGNPSHGPGECTKLESCIGGCPVSAGCPTYDNNCPSHVFCPDPTIDTTIITR